MPSYFKVFPKTLGEFRGSRGDPADHIFDTVVNIDGGMGRLHVEVLFRAVQDLDIEEFFRGFEYTHLWLPEADTNTDLEAILSIGSNRAGRYPEPEDRPDPDAPGFVAAFKGISCDANAPIIGTYFHQRFYVERGLRRFGPGNPDGTDNVLVQPSGFSPNAENLMNLRRIDPAFYANQAKLLSAYDVPRLLGNRPGYGRHGQPVHPNFNEERHVTHGPIAVDPHTMLIISVDAGSGSLRPGATFEQRRHTGQWCYLEEIFVPQAEQMTTPQLGEAIRRIAEGPRFADVVRTQGAVICIDPAAITRSPQTEYTDAHALQQAAGIEVQLAPTNKPDLRRNALDKLFLASVPGSSGEPMIAIDPRCTNLIHALAGGWHYPRRAGQLSTISAKNEWANIGEAAEYGPLAIDGLDASEGRFIRPGDEGGHYEARGIPWG